MSDLREQLQGIYNKVGTLTPQIVVEEARDESHPLHNRFEWDDAVAGEAYRRYQAHQLITSVKITYVKDDKREKVRAWHAVRGENDAYVYEPAEKVAEDPALKEILLRDMRREFSQMRSRYEKFSEFVELCEEVADSAA